MRRSLTALFIVFSAAALSSSGDAANRMVPNSQLADAEQRAEAAERRELIREAADRLEDAQSQQAYNRFEIWTGLLIGFFSVLITILVLIFGFRTARAAAVEAATAAHNEVAKRIDAIEALAEKARVASASTEASAQRASEEIEKIRLGAEALMHASERTRVEAGDAGKPQVTLTADETAAVKAGVAATPEISNAILTVDEFRVGIGNAAYVTKDQAEALRLASLMEAYHPDNDEAVSFALRAQGDALRELKRWERAIGVYSELIERFEGHPSIDITWDVLWARYNKAQLLTEMSRYSEAAHEFQDLVPLEQQFFGADDANTLATRAELARVLVESGCAADGEQELRRLVPLAERVMGVDHTSTLTIRHELARSLLYQGRADEAERVLRELLPIRERVEGAEHSNTFATRHELARAILYQGRVTEAQEEFRTILGARERVYGPDDGRTLVTRYWLADSILRAGNADEAQRVLGPIPDDPPCKPWLRRWTAELAFVRGRIADAVGRTDDASQWLAKARTSYAALFPPNHPSRRELEGYLARRQANPRE